MRSEEETFWDYIRTYKMPCEPGHNLSQNKDFWVEWYESRTRPERMTQNDRVLEEGDLHRLTTLDEFWQGNAELLREWVEKRLSDLRKEE